MALHPEIGHSRAKGGEIDLWLRKGGGSLGFSPFDGQFDAEFGLQGLAAAAEVDADGD